MSPILRGKDTRRAALWAGCGLTLAWLVLLRYGLQLLVISPFIPGGLIVLTVGMCEGMAETLAAAIL